VADDIGNKQGVVLTAANQNVREYVNAALKNGHLIRKSFEYRLTSLDVEELSNRTAVLQVNQPPLDAKSDLELNKYWAREQAFAQLFRVRYGMSYQEYLPGRVYTYRALFRRISETIDIRSIIDVGCGSGMILHEAARKGITTSGIDISANALIFARYLAAEFGTKNLTLVNADALSPWQPPVDLADLVSNLGSLEHLPFEDQVKFAGYMGRLSRKYVLLSVPNLQSPLFTTMESKELGIEDNQWVYPEEYQHFVVDFARIGVALGWSVVSESCVHIPSTSLTGYSAELRPMLDGVQRENPVSRISSEELMNAWLKVEASCPDQLLESLGWFRFVIFKIH